MVGIDHVQLAMPAGREDDAEAFYVDLLGLARVPKPPPLAARGGCWFEAPGVKVHLGVDEDFRPARKAHPALVVDYHGALRSRFAAAGVEVRDGDDPSGRPQAYVDDPFGTRIELVAAGVG